MRSNHQDHHLPCGGYTLIDLLVVMLGGVPASWVSSYFIGVWYFPILAVCTLVFGIGFWCMVFLWLLPWWERRRQVRKQ
jgi:hypothetical protein